MIRAALAAILATLVLAPPAFASGTVTVNIVGAGRVTGTGLDCQRLGGVTTGDCTNFVENIVGQDEGVCDRLPVPCELPGAQFLNGHDLAETGFTFDRWSTFCAQVNPCTIHLSTLPNSNVTVTVTFLDVERPTAALTQPTDGAAVAGRIPLTATAADNGGVASVAFRVRGTPLPVLTTPPFTTNFDTQTLPDGPAAITVTATDGRQESMPATANVTIDNTRPTLTVTGPDGRTFGRGEVPEWTIAAGDATTGPPVVRCSVVPAGAPPVFGACTNAGAHRLPGHADGRFTLTVRATDRAGNSTDQARAFAVDTGPPETTITSGPDDGASTDGATITWGIASSESGSTFECRIAPAPFGPCSAATQHSASGLAPGTYTFEVRAIDALRNVDPSPARRSVTVRPPIVAEPIVFVPDPVVIAEAVAQAAAAVAAARPTVLSVGLAYHYPKSTARTTTFDKLTVEDVPAGATVTALCPKGCAKKRFVKARAAGRVTLKSLIRRPLKVNTVITVIVSKPGAVSAVKVFKVRSRRAPRITSLCLADGARKPGACP